MRILIVDDERMISEWMQYCIEKHPDCQVVGCAKNGEEALELFRKMTPDVVFTDIKMPVMDGIELLKQVKKESPETVGGRLQNPVCRSVQENRKRPKDRNG